MVVDYFLVAVVLVVSVVIDVVVGGVPIRRARDVTIGCR